jgi:hypothetical protein
MSVVHAILVEYSISGPARKSDMNTSDSTRGDEPLESQPVDYESVEGSLEWRPLIITLIGLTNGLRSGGSWRMQTMVSSRDYDAGLSPLARATAGSNGTVTVEIVGNSVPANPTPSIISTLESLGWLTTAGTFLSAHRTYAPGFNANTISVDILDALTNVFKLTSNDLFDFGDRSDSVAQFGVMTPVSNTVFSMDETENDDDDEHSPIEAAGAFDAAVEILARLIEANIIDSVGTAVSGFTAEGSTKRQGFKYQRSAFSDNDIFGWFVDVTSWTDPEQTDWVDHIEQLDAVDSPLLLMTGEAWALTVRRGQRDSEVPDGLAHRLRAILPGGFVQWSRGHEGEWFTPAHKTVQSVARALEHDSWVVRVEQPPADLDQYLVECLGDDTFGFLSVGLAGEARALVGVLIDNNLASESTFAFSSYMPPSAGSVDIAGDGWVMRVIEASGQEFSVTDFAEQLALSLDATHSPDVDLDDADGARAIDTTTWGPQAEFMRDMLLWESRHTAPLPPERRSEQRAAAWGRISEALENSGRSEGIQEAVCLMSSISTNDFFSHSGCHALTAVGVRDLISTDDYDEFTLLWRRNVGILHPDDDNSVPPYPHEFGKKHGVWPRES